MDRLIYATIAHPTDSTAWDIEHTRSVILKHNKRYLLEIALVGRICTDIWIKGVDFPLDSAYFDFQDKQGKPVDIYNIKEFQGYT